MMEIRDEEATDGTPNTGQVNLEGLGALKVSTGQVEGQVQGALSSWFPCPHVQFGNKVWGQPSPRRSCVWAAPWQPPSAQPLLSSHANQTVGQGPWPGFPKLCSLVSNFLQFVSGIEIRGFALYLQPLKNHEEPFLRALGDPCELREGSSGR